MKGWERFIPKGWRYRLAEWFDRHTDACWAELVMWCEFEDSAFPPRQANPRCIVDCLESDTCWCGKFPRKWGLEATSDGFKDLLTDSVRHTEWAGPQPHRRGPPAPEHLMYVSVVAVEKSEVRPGQSRR